MSNNRELSQFASLIAVNDSNKSLAIGATTYITNSAGIGTNSASFTADIAGDLRVQDGNKMRFGGTAGTTNFYIQYNSTTNSLDFISG